MSLVTIFLTQNGEKDDIIRITRDSEYRSVYAVTYQANDVSKRRTFYLGENDTMNYLSDVFKSLDFDTAPFVNVQVSTAIHPTIMYDANDLADTDIRHRVEDMIHMTLRTKVHSSRSESE
jgi:hypothetical protein